MTDMTNTLVDAGAHFNDATTLLEGGLTPATLGLYETDVKAAVADFSAILTTNGGAGLASVGGVALSAQDVSVLTTEMGQMNANLVQAPLAVTTTDPVAATGPAAAAQNFIVGGQENIISAINGDLTLADALVVAAEQTPGAQPGFQLLPVGNDSAAEIVAAEAYGASLKDIGQVFNAVENLELGGNVNNLPQIDKDLVAIQTGLMNMISFPTATPALAAIESGETATAAAATTAHLQTLLADINLQIQHDGTDSGATLSTETNANMLAMIDLVQNDPALNVAAGGTGHPGGGGFGELPVYLPSTAAALAHPPTITPPPPPPPPVALHGDPHGHALGDFASTHGVGEHFWLHG
jgi:hypothetical protein